ncbi:thermonuclease family protein [Sphingomonas glaciei]|uniref:Thermonuclease family protein n=1 Tax=Sphingomonas glaciei TaxID=2938948 RepID=A0ABY5MT41_9SPHN|nr:thermonuclease family protein [Sphingomonas glaciei]UUR07587.1 thermonuclease family protein [Sphingomonas glaciei]
MRSHHTPFVLAALAIALASTVATAAPGEIFWGTARAKDGDSLVVGSREVRLFGIDAPEFDQSCKRAGTNWQCGTEAAQKLAALVTGREVRCVSSGVDQYARTLATCTVGQVDINRTMVATGFAVAFRRYSSNYVSAEESAKVKRRGLWSGEFQMPQAFRAAEQPTAPSRLSAGRSDLPVKSSSNYSAVRSKGNCNIKGNRNRKGQWIYHVPGMPYYDQTRAEDIFCTEAEAQAAGYRRAIVRR